MLQDEFGGGGGGDGGVGGATPWHGFAPWIMVPPQPFSHGRGTKPQQPPQVGLRGFAELRLWRGANDALHHQRVPNHPLAWRHQTPSRTAGQCHQVARVGSGLRLVSAACGWSRSASNIPQQFVNSFHRRVILQEQSLLSTPELSAATNRVKNQRKLVTGLLVDQTELLGKGTIRGGDRHFKRMKQRSGEIVSSRDYRPTSLRNSSFVRLTTEPVKFVQIRSIVVNNNAVFVDVNEIFHRPIHCYDPLHELTGENGVAVDHIVRITATSDIIDRYPVNVVDGVCVKILDYLVHIPFVHCSSS
jgi:hypothetical protein